MKVVFDSHIPFLTEAVRKAWQEVDIYPMKSEEIDHDALRDADVLIVRTRTKVNEVLLRDTKVQQVCTATIGFDHIDTAYCDACGIQWSACPGCNAQAVCDYIEEALDEIHNSKFTIHNSQFKIQNSSPTMGVVGVGHVGSLVAKMAERRGLKVLLNDPPKQIGISLDKIAKNCDIITFHVPLDASTYHLCDEAFLNRCKPDALIINASRGGVVNEEALLRSGRPYILDTWENEPHLCPEVLQNALLASMHIAGYSVEGKRTATQMCLDAVAARWGLPPVKVEAPQPTGDSARGWLRRVSEQLKAHPEAFEQLRQNYPLR